MNELFLSNDADGQVKRVAGHFGLIVAAGELVIKFGLVDWAIDTPFNAANNALTHGLIIREVLGPLKILLYLRKSDGCLCNMEQAAFKILLILKQFVITG